jgi:hypothetical protein
MKILLASSEVHPFSKTGGLADMVGALGKALAAAGHEVAIVTPLYRGIRERFTNIQPTEYRVDVPLGATRVQAGSVGIAKAMAKGEPITPAACGAQDAAPATWQACRDALFGPEGPFAQMRNPFNAANTVLGTQCQRQSAATRGHVLVHKGTPPPQGVAGSMYWSPIDGKETLVKGLALRVQVCDAGGYAIKVAEVTL